MPREYVRAQPKDDQTCEQKLHSSSPQSGFVQPEDRLQDRLADSRSWIALGRELIAAFFSRSRQRRQPPPRAVSLSPNTVPAASPARHRPRPAFRTLFFAAHALRLSNSVARFPSSRHRNKISVTPLALSGSTNAEFVARCWFSRHTFAVPRLIFFVSESHFSEFVALVFKSRHAFAKSEFVVSVLWSRKRVFVALIS